MSGLRQARPGPHPPQVRPVRLPDALTDAADVAAGDTLEARRVSLGALPGVDLSQTTFRECRLYGAGGESPRLRGAHLVESIVEDMDTAALSAPASTWREVAWRSSRVGAAELYEANWRSVTVAGLKIGFLNGRSCQWQDVIFRDCVIDELDLAGASLQRVAFEGCRLGTLDLQRATVRDLDVRGAELGVLLGREGLSGAWISEAQLLDLAPQFAVLLGLLIG